MIVVAQVIGGLLLLFAGGELLIKGAVSIAKKLGLSPFVIGLTIVAYGTSSPELLVSVQAALNNHSAIALGNVVGSNISNILCVIGLTALIYPIAVDKSESGFDLKIMLIATCGLITACMFGVVGAIFGAIFITALIIYTALVFKKPKDDIEIEDIEPSKNISKAKAIIFCIAGIVLLMFGAEFLVKGAVTLAKIANISEVVIGVTLVALGGSLPELITSVVAAFHKKSDIVLGNIIGSNLFNILGIIGVTTIIKPIEVNQRFIEIDLPFLFFTTALIVYFVFTSNLITRTKGLILFSGYIIYVSMQFVI